MTFNHCGRRLVLRVYDGFDCANLTKPVDVPLPGYADAVRAMFEGIISDDWPTSPRFACRSAVGAGPHPGWRAR